MKLLDNKSKILVEIIILSLFISIISTTYAYFTIMVNGKSNTNIVESGSMLLSFEDGPSISMDNMLPNQSIEKTFTIENLGTIDTSYDVYFSELINTFQDKNDLVYTLISSNGCSVPTKKVVPSVSGEKLINQCSIDKGTKHSYTLKITFLETEDDQNDNLGRGFSTKLSLNEYKTINNIAIIEDGIKFNTHIKKLAGTIEGNDYTNEYNHPLYSNNEDLNKRNATQLSVSRDYNIKNIELSSTLPSNNVNTILVNDPLSNYDIKAWFDNNTIYLYTLADKIYLSENASFMFSGLSGLTNLDLTFFDTTNTKDMSYMFSATNNLVGVDISSFDTSNVVDMKRMFYETNKIKTIDLSSFNTSNVTNMSQMFKDMYVLTNINLGNNFDTSKVTDMYQMFAHQRALRELDLGDKFSVESVVNGADLFQTGVQTSFAKKIYTTKDLIFKENADISHVFWNTNISGGYGTKVVGDNDAGDYAVIDCGEKRPGYLTFKGTTQQYEEFCAQYN